MTTTNLSQRVQRIKPSATLAISAKAGELKAAGKSIISLSAGEPDFDTPQHIKDAAIKAINDGFTKYTPVPGIPALRQAIADKLARENNLSYSASQIVVSTGAKQSIYNLMQALLDGGDEVIIPAPYWVSYPDIALLANAKPVVLATTLEQDFKITPEQLENAITPKTKLFLINSPSNPSGKVYSKSELTTLGQVLLKHPQITIMTDDIYEHIIWAKEPFSNIINACPELIDRTVIINGVSKGYAMTGWRIGYGAGPEKLIKAMSKIQSQSTSNASAISQHAALAAIAGDQACIETMLSAFKERHDAAVKLINALPGFECQPADGAFYLFPRVTKAIEALAASHSEIKDDIALADYLLDSAGVAVVPGSAFGMPGYLRLSIALGLETFAEAIEKINAACS